MTNYCVLQITVETSLVNNQSQRTPDLVYKHTVTGSRNFGWQIKNGQTD